MRKNVSFGNVPRDPHCSSEVWLVEPFDEELDLWTIGAQYGFVWAVLPGRAEAPRCRSVPRGEGIAEIREQLRVDPLSVVLAGHLVGDGIYLECAHTFVTFDRDSPIDTTDLHATFTRVCDRLRDLQYYDGEERVERFERDAESGGTVSDTFWGTLGIDFA